MTREIKFRAWHPIEKKMFYSQHDGIAMPYMRGDAFIPIVKDVRGNLDEFKSLQLMQYTGLKDQNGKEIYEGDIVKWEHGASKNDSGTDRVQFSAGQFHFPKGYALEVFYSPWSNNLRKHLEVIGNIHESPELLTNKTV